MKRVLLTALAIGAASISVVPSAMAQTNDGIQLGIAGFMRGYVVAHKQDDVAGFESRDFDILRDTEVHFKGHMKLDNGLTVGFHTELRDDLGDNFAVDESYAYFSGDWGRVNFGAENGAAYLLQVAIPAADSNIDGLRQFISPVNFNALTGGVRTTGFQADYSTGRSGKFDKLTYITPVFSGFQAGVSYTPEMETPSRSLGVAEDDQAGDLGSAYEAGALYKRDIGDVKLTLGTGYVLAEVERATATRADSKSWNVTGVIGYQGFQFGAVYFNEDNTNGAKGIDRDGFSLGVDYTTGPWTFGASYLNAKFEELAPQNGDTERYSVGVVYNVGSGVSFRSSVRHVEYDFGGTLGERDATSFILGTQINF